MREVEPSRRRLALKMSRTNGRHVSYIALQSLKACTISGRLDPCIMRDILLLDHGKSERHVRYGLDCCRGQPAFGSCTRAGISCKSVVSFEVPLYRL